MNFRNETKPIFYEYDVTADCNDNIFYLVSDLFKFFNKQQDTDYIYAAYSLRHDSIELNSQLGLKVVWEDLEEQNRLNLKIPPRFVEGDFKTFLS